MLFTYFSLVVYSLDPRVSYNKMLSIYGTPCLYSTTHVNSKETLTCITYIRTRLQNGQIVEVWNQDVAWWGYIELWQRPCLIVIGLVINKINVWALEQSIFWQRSTVQKLVLKIYI